MAQLSAHSFVGALVLSILATIGAVTLLWTEVWLVALDFALFALVCRFYCFAPLGARELFWLAPGMIHRHQRINWRGGDLYPFRFAPGLAGALAMGWTSCAPRPAPEQG